MRDRIKRLQEERQAIWKQMTDILENESRDGVLPAEAAAQYDALEKNMDAKGAEVERCQRHIETEARLAAPRDLGAEHRDGGAPESREQSVTATEEYRSAFDRMIRGGMAKLRPEQRDLLSSQFVESRDQGVGTGAAGGFMVPQGFLLKITERQKYYGPLRRLANIIETASGNAMPWPNNDDTSNVATILGENVAATELDVTLSSKTLNSYMWNAGLVKVSYQLLNDSAFDVEAFLAKKFATRFGRGQNTKFTTGTGTGQPLGILNGGTPSQNVFQAAVGNTTAVTYANLIETQHALDVAYRTPGPKTGWQMHDTTLKTIRKLVDSNGRPLWVPEQSYGSIVSGAQGELLGHPVFVNNDMAVPAASAFTIGFGDWESYYIIRDVLGVQMVRLDERFADQLQVGFLAFARTDATIDDAFACSWHQQSAT